MSKKLFNLRYSQPHNQPNSLTDISNLSGIPINFLTKILNEGLTKKLTNKRIPQGAYAMGQVYAFVNSVRNGGVAEHHRKTYLELMIFKQKK